MTVPTEKQIEGYVFELAKARNTETGEYCDWGEPQFSFTEPCVPEGSIRNLKPLSAALAVEAGAVSDIVPDHCSGAALAFEGGCLHVRKDGSGYIVVDEGDFILEDDRCEGEHGPEGSVHWIARFSAGEMTALREFLNGQDFSATPASSAVEGEAVRKPLWQQDAENAEASAKEIRAMLSGPAPTPAGDGMLRLAVAAVLEADKEFRSNMGPSWEGDPLSDEIDGLRRIFEATLSERERRTAQGETVPEGWALVPIDPTQEMLDEACSSDPHPIIKYTEPHERDGSVPLIPIATWRAMMAARPASPIPQTEDPNA